MRSAKRYGARSARLGWEREPALPGAREGASKPPPTHPRRKKILAISSGGGHWIELLRLRPALRGHFVVYVTVSEAYRDHVPGAPFYVIDDVTRWDGLGVLRTAGQVLRILLEQRPDAIVSTGALPGLFGVVIGKLLGARTIWVDSLANVDELSMSGRRAGPHADLWLTQWPELAREGGPCYAGSVLE